MLLIKLQAMRAKKGFTLVELIVVIAIIAILAAILIPILVNHVKNSKCSAAIADCKNASQIVSEHIADHVTKPETVPDGDFDDTVKKCTVPGCAWVGHGVKNVKVNYTSTNSAFEQVTAKESVGNHVFPVKTIGCSNGKCQEK